jgi:hypothetical protein
MGDEYKVQDLEALAALLADIEKESEGMGEGDKGMIRELHQHCVLRLALLKSANAKGQK